MGFAFPAFHQARLPGMFNAAAVEAAMQRLGWSDIRRTAGTVTGRVAFNVWSFGETVAVTLTADHALLRSACVMPTQCLDWGKNRRNIEALRAALAR